MFQRINSFMFWTDTWWPVNFIDYWARLIKILNKWAIFQKFKQRCFVYSLRSSQRLLLVSFISASSIILLIKIKQQIASAAVVSNTIFTRLFFTVEECSECKSEISIKPLFGLWLFITAGNHCFQETKNFNFLFCFGIWLEESFLGLFPLSLDFAFISASSIFLLIKIKQQIASAAVVSNTIFTRLFFTVEECSECKSEISIKPLFGLWLFITAGNHFFQETKNFHFLFFVLESDWKKVS